MSNPAHPLNGLRFLVVEDEAIIGLMLQSMLGSFGCVIVDVASTLLRGMAIATNERVAIDAAILDINLGGEHVYPVAERLRARHVPFIFSTGYGRSNVISAFAREPMLTKPYEAEDLEGVLVKLLAHRNGNGHQPPPVDLGQPPMLRYH